MRQVADTVLLAITVLLAGYLALVGGVLLFRELFH